MKQFFLAVHSVEGGAPPSPPEVVPQQMHWDVGAFNAELQAEGALVFGGGLLPVHTATVVRVKDGEVTNSSGPFAESKVSLGGMWIIEAPDLDAAFVWAAKGSVACQAPVEVRPFGG